MTNTLTAGKPPSTSVTMRGAVGLSPPVTLSFSIVA
jgi:hypothetical protein